MKNLILLENYKKQVREAVMYLNHYNDYIDSEVIKENKGKIKKIRKVLF